MAKPILAAILSCATTTLSDEEKYLFEKYNPLGISLFGRNLQSKTQVKKLVDDIKNVINRDDVLIAIDEEGGRVSRLANINKNRYADAETLGEMPADYCRSHALIIAQELRQLGININYAPVIDKKTNPQSRVLETRCFSGDDDIIVEHATAMANAYIEMGICPCIKHIPGHFESNKDPHLFLPKTKMNEMEIKENIQYIKNFNKYPLAMTAHIFISAMDKKNPATCSQKIINDLIRSYLEYDGFLLSDAIDMHALKGTIAKKTENCLDAGVDAICYCGGKYNELMAICEKERFLTEKSLIRFAKIKKVIHNNPKHFAIKEIRNHYMRGMKDRLDAEYSYDATEVLHQMQQKGEN